MSCKSSCKLNVSMACARTSTSDTQCASVHRVFGTGGGTCELCGAKLRLRRKLDYIIAQVNSGSEGSKLVCSFIDRFGSAFCDRRLHAVADMRHHTRKELSESMAALEAIEDILKRTSLEVHKVDQERMFVLDCCCSVGLTTSLLATAFPFAVVVGVDCDTRLVGRTHFQHPSRHSIVRADILAFDDKFDALASGRGLVVICAVHACGLLALKPIELFKRWITHASTLAGDRSGALVLVPCCVPLAHDSYFGSGKCKTGATEVTDDYEAWCCHLGKQISAIDKHVQCSWRRVTGVLSPRNMVISASWSKDNCDGASDQHARMHLAELHCALPHSGFDDPVLVWQKHLAQRRASASHGSNSGLCVGKQNLIASGTCFVHPEWNRRCHCRSGVECDPMPVDNVNVAVSSGGAGTIPGQCDAPDSM